MSRNLSGWDGTLHTGLRIDDTYGDRIFAVELLILRDEPEEYHVEQGHPFMRGVRLHRWLDIGGGHRQHNAVVLFHPDLIDMVPPPFRNFINQLHPNAAVMSRFDLLRDVLRAYIAAGNQGAAYDPISSVRDAETHLVGYRFRSIFQRAGLLEEINRLDSEGSIYLENHIRLRLWMTNLDR